MQSHTQEQPLALTTVKPHYPTNGKEEEVNTGKTLHCFFLTIMWPGWFHVAALIRSTDWCGWHRWKCVWGISLTRWETENATCVTRHALILSVDFSFRSAVRVCPWLFIAWTEFSCPHGLVTRSMYFFLCIQRWLLCNTYAHTVTWKPTLQAVLSLHMSGQ